jgi:hypothetical protein
MRGIERTQRLGRRRAARLLAAGWLAVVVLMLTGCDGNLTIATGSAESATAGPRAIWQVGVQAPQAAAHATALRVRMQARLPQSVATDTTNYFWVGSYLRDGSFIQVGYYVPWYQSDEAGWFYCAFATPQSSGDCNDGTLGAVGGGAWHIYGLAATADADGSGSPGWVATFDGQRVGAFAWPVQDTGAHAPTIFAESSSTTLRDAPTGDLGPVDFSQFTVRRDGQRTDQTITTGLPAYNAPNVCPPFGIGTDGSGGVLLGSGLACPAALDMVSWG